MAAHIHNYEYNTRHTQLVKSQFRWQELAVHGDLGVRCGTVVSARALLFLSYEEAAAVMGCSRSTLAVRLARARKRLASVALAPLGRSRPYAES